MVRRPGLSNIWTSNLTPVQTLSSHSTPIVALDFSEPYGTLVSAAQEDPHPRVWDLLSGQEIGRLRGHVGTVKCLQVEDHVCLTGSEDSTVRLWDLRRVVEDEDVDIVTYSDTIGSDASDGEMVERPNNIRDGGSQAGRETAFVRALEGHSKAVTSMYFEDDCLVGGFPLGLTLQQLLINDICRSLVPPIRQFASGISRQDNVS